MDRRNMERYMPILTAFLLGGLIGAGATLLAAPKSGRETREMLRDRSMSLKNRAIGTAEDTIDRAEKAIDDITSTTKDRASKIGERSRHLIQRGKDRTEEEISSLRSR